MGVRSSVSIPPEQRDLPVSLRSVGRAGTGDAKMDCPLPPTSMDVDDLLAFQELGSGTSYAAADGFVRHAAGEHGVATRDCAGAA